MKRKVMALVLCVAMASTMLLSGCGSSAESAAPAEESAAPAAEEEAPAAEEEAPAAEEEAPAAEEEAPAAEEEAPAADAASEEIPSIDGSQGLTYQATELSAGCTFGISVQTQANPFFLKEITSLEETLATAEGATVLSPDPANDLTTQVQQITDFVVKGVDCILIDPLDSQGIQPALEEAARAGIPVIAVDSACDDSSKLLSFIESNNKNLGRLAAESLCEAIGGEGKIAVIDWNTLEAVRLRVQGLQEIIEEKYPNVEIVADENAYGVVEDAQTILETIMNANPDLKGVFAINDPTAQGCIAAIEAAGKTGEIFVSSVDGSQTGIDYIKDGKLLCSPVQFPGAMASEAVRMFELYKAGKVDEIPAHEYVDGCNITIDNVADFDGQTY